MIRLFDRDETNFDHNETPLPDVLSALVELEANGMYELIIEYPRNEFAKTLTAGKILKAPTPKGEQLFRIYKPIKNLKTYKIYARHIFYDLAKNFLENIRPTTTSGNSAIASILNGSAIEHRFTGASDIAELKTANYVRMSPIEALLGASNSFLSVWGGELTRDNFTFRIDAKGGRDRGYEVRLGKNLIGIEADVDESNVYTCIYPTVVIDGNTVTTLPEKYVYSPLVNNYESVYVIEERIELTDDEKKLSLQAIYTLMRERAEDLFEQGADKPEVNYKVDFVELSKTEQYKHLQILEQLDIYDTVDVIVNELDIRVKAKVIKYTYDALKERYVSMELGDFKQNLASQTKNTLGLVDKQINQSANKIREAFERSNDLITGNLGGHVIMRRNAEGLPYEILIMDTADIQTAKNVIRMNQQGVGFSNSGYNGPFGVAITIDGTLNAEIMNVFNINVDNIIGNTSEFVKTAWNSIDNSTEATATGLTSSDSSGRQIAYTAGAVQFRNSEMERYQLDADQRFKGLNFYPMDGVTNDNGLAISGKGTNILSFGQDEDDDGYEWRFEQIHDGEMIIQSKNSQTLRLLLGASTQLNRWHFYNATDSTWAELAYGNVKLTFTPVPSSGSGGALSAQMTNGTYIPMRASGFDVTSDRELKDNIKPIKNALVILNKLKVYTYTKEGKEEIGFIADEVPTSLQGSDSKTVSIYDTLALTTKSVQELSEENKALKEEIRIIKEHLGLT
ncbi:hypothetical protein B795N_00340 [Marinilactibacillus psychrotolerans]|uniref:phage tail spike protein n=1 Tax=Marinilactibacillus psychrotolerans TaxID=191770 RepID=UPI001C7DD28D|nr:phage tail spike protein [Marinilactibacillus psychrotolerans]GEQ32152.1 hypothetical protein B795N_00340 [Marinilactibacillus psychrotolerans]